MKDNYKIILDELLTEKKNNIKDDYEILCENYWNKINNKPIKYIELKKEITELRSDLFIIFSVTGYRLHNIKIFEKISLIKNDLINKIAFYESLINFYDKNVLASEIMKVFRK